MKTVNYTVLICARTANLLADSQWSSKEILSSAVLVLRSAIKSKSFFRSLNEIKHQLTISISATQVAISLSTGSQVQALIWRIYKACYSWLIITEAQLITKQLWLNLFINDFALYASASTDNIQIQKFSSLGKLSNTFFWTLGLVVRLAYIVPDCIYHVETKKKNTIRLQGY